MDHSTTVNSTVDFHDLDGIEQLGEAVRNLSHRLTTTQRSEIPQTIISFATSMPDTLTIAQQAALGGLFERYLEYLGLPAYFGGYFWDSLPVAIELQERDADEEEEWEPTPEFMDGSPPYYLLPEWFDPVIPVAQTPQQHVEKRGKGSPEYMVDFKFDLLSLANALQRTNTTLEALVSDENLREFMLLRNDLDLNLVLSPEVSAILEADIALVSKESFRNGLLNAEGILRKVSDRVVLVDMALRRKEDTLLADPVTHVRIEGHFLRWARASYRFALNDVCRNMRCEWLRKPIPMEYSKRLIPIAARPQGGDTECVVCTEELTDNSIDTTYTPCCNRGYHSECLLTWCFGKLSGQPNKQMTCPMCRSEIKFVFLADLMEAQISKMTVGE